MCYEQEAAEFIQIKQFQLTNDMTFNRTHNWISFETILSTVEWGFLICYTRSGDINDYEIKSITINYKQYQIFNSNTLFVRICKFTLIYIHYYYLFIWRHPFLLFRFIWNNELINAVDVKNPRTSVICYKLGLTVHFY